eukprot:828600-Prymnesium_polylepis.3
MVVLHELRQAEHRRTRRAVSRTRALAPRPAPRKRCTQTLPEHRRRVASTPPAPARAGKAADN